jgi:hypothetical protein
MTNQPASIESRPYKGLEIEVELYERSEGGFYAMPYVVKPRSNGMSKRRFLLNIERFATKEAALEAAIAEGQKLIDQGFDAEELV